MKKNINLAIITCLVCGFVACSENNKKKPISHEEQVVFTDSIKLQNKTRDTSIRRLPYSIVFRVSLSSFFHTSHNDSKGDIKDVYDLMNFVPVYFYKEGSHFIIPNRLNKEITEFDSLGKKISEVHVGNDIDITKFFIDSHNQELLLLDNGLKVFDLNGNQKYSIPDVIDFSLARDRNIDNFFVEKKKNGKFYYKDFGGKISKQIEVIPGSEYFERDSMFQLLRPQDDSTHFIINKMNLKSSDVYSSRYKISCSLCFNLPSLIYRDLIISANYKTTRDELMVLRNNTVVRYDLETPNGFSPIPDMAFAAIMTNGFLYYYDPIVDVLYSLGTDEKEIVVLAYNGVRGRK